MRRCGRRGAADGPCLGRWLALSVISEEGVSNPRKAGLEPVYPPSARPARAFFAFRVGPEPGRTSARSRRAYGRLQRYRAVRIRYAILLSSPSVVVPPPSPRARQRAWSPVL